MKFLTIILSLILVGPASAWAKLAGVADCNMYSKGCLETQASSKDLNGNSPVIPGFDRLQVAVNDSRSKYHLVETAGVFDGSDNAGYSLYGAPDARPSFDSNGAPGSTQGTEQ